MEFKPVASLKVFRVAVNAADFAELCDMLGAHAVCANQSTIMVPIDDPGSYASLTIQASFDTLYDVARKDEGAERLEFVVNA